jgi:hypothetical protein
VAVAVSPAAKCVRILSDPSRIKSKGMRMKQEGTVLVKRKNYAVCSMEDVPPIPEYKIEMEKGKYDGIRVYCSIRTDPDLGIGWADVRPVAFGCGPCKLQLKMPWVPRVDRRVQPQYAKNNGCKLWPSFEGQNDWRICKLVPQMTEDERDVQQSNKCILIVMEARISLMIQEGKIGVVATTDEAAVGYYVVKWLSKLNSLQEDIEDMPGVHARSRMRFFIIGWPPPPKYVECSILEYVVR